MSKYVVPEIPAGSILGLNYSGMHDSAIAIVSPEGKPIFALSLERVSRVKQDGRVPYELLENIPWTKISSIAISTNESLVVPDNSTSKIHPIRFDEKRVITSNSHGSQFYDFLETLPKPIEYICHHKSHASSAFWPSGMESSLCLTYDGGMANCAWFGGLYQASREAGITALDQFGLESHPRITVLYSAITALLGFTPNKHEGKITGLAAQGKPTQRCRELMSFFLSDGYHKLESLFDWFFIYESERVPVLAVNEGRRAELNSYIEKFSKEELAATLQAVTEEHILTIINNAREQGWSSPNICLSGGLFANVKVNQRIKESGFERVFVSPPMTDDGTAYGAALEVLAQQNKIKHNKVHSMALGPAYSENEIEQALSSKNVVWEKVPEPTECLAQLLAEGKNIAVFIGSMEFGPRALGNRSVISSAENKEINISLNEKFNRTEFMPFAPMSLIEDAAECYKNLSGTEHTAEFMTITMDCHELMVKKCPAVVHIDNTARPQLISKESSPFIHSVINKFKDKTGQYAIINTSFNIHEEPIVCTPEDAVNGFLESGLDFLYLDPGYLLSFEDNKNAALTYLQKQRAKPSVKSIELIDMNKELWNRLDFIYSESLLKNSELKRLAIKLQSK